jgi:hypothetical protein
MHDEDMSDPARAFDEAERDVLYLQTEPSDGQPIWSVEDIGREIESQGAITFVRGLLRAGLVNRTGDGFVFATRAAVRMAQLADRAV